MVGTFGQMDPDMLQVSRSCAIPLSELRWRFSRSGGPGGQHANTSDTRAEVIFDVESSPSLGPRQRQRLLAKIGPEVRAVASDERSQARNRELALQRLKARIAGALFIEKQRTATRPTKGSKERRLADKKRQSERKRSRRDLEE
jgi:ribosome-associated protein